MASVSPHVDQFISLIVLNVVLKIFYGSIHNASSPPPPICGHFYIQGNIFLQHLMCERLNVKTGNLYKNTVGGGKTGEWEWIGIMTKTNGIIWNYRKTQKSFQTNSWNENRTRRQYRKWCATLQHTTPLPVIRRYASAIGDHQLTFFEIQNNPVSKMFFHGTNRNEIENYGNLSSMNNKNWLKTNKKLLWVVIQNMNNEYDHK